MPAAWGYISNKPLDCEGQIHETLKTTFPFKHDFIFSKENFHIGFLLKEKESVTVNRQYIFENEDEIVFCMGHVDNINEIAHIINMPSIKPLHETFIMYQAYLAKKEKIFSSFLGAWLFVSYQKHSGELILARDHTGIYTWYYTVLMNKIIFSTHIAPIFSCNEVSKEMNLLQLAGISVGFPGKADETSFLQIKKVPPAQILHILNKHVISRKYWSTDAIKPRYYKNRQDYFDHFIELYRQCICEKFIGNNLASTLSSGLDSTFVTAIAADELSKRGKTLHAITSIPLYDTQPKKSTRYSDEAPLASLVAAAYPNIIHHFDNAEQTNPIDGLLKSLTIHHYPLRNATNQYWLNSLFENLKQLNIDTLLIGQMGNITISWPFFDSPVSLKNKTTRLLRSIFPIDLWKKPSYIKNSFLSEDFIRENHFMKYLWDSQYKPYYYSPSLKRIRHYYFDFFQLTGYTSWQEKADYYGMNVFDPTADVRIIEYCFSLPDELYKNKNGHRLLVREVAKNFLPEKVINNNSRGLQASDIQLRLQNGINNYLPLIKQTLDSVSNTKIFDMPNLEKNYLLFKNSPYVLLRIFFIFLFINFVTSKKRNRIIG